jgi:hypothetical protein
MKNNVIILISSIALLAIAFFPFIFVGNLGDYESEVEKLIAPMEEAQFVKKYFAHVQARDLEAVKIALDPKVVDATFPQKFDEMADIFPSETPKSIKFIGASTRIYDGILTTKISSEYEFSGRWVFASAFLQKKGSSFVLIGFDVQSSNESLKNRTQFEFWGQDVKHYVVLSIAMILLLLNIYALALCINTEMPKRKWLWIIFILVGFGTVEFNWLDGSLYYFGSYDGQKFNIISFKFPVVGFSQVLYQSLVITMTVPVGAIVFLLRRKKWIG